LTRFDIVIAGAGLPGLALAAALAQAGLRTALVDRGPIAAPEPDPGSWDPRVYAISPGSAAFLHRIGAWQALASERLSAVESMRIEGDGTGRLEFTAYELGQRALAWICEERALRAALLPAVHAAGVVLHGGVGLEDLAWSAEQATLTLADGVHLEARLIVGADGIRSWVRTAAGMLAIPRPYGQTAVVAAYDCACAHHGCARQWFASDGGVLAWLPLPQRRISIVWSAPDALAAELLSMPAEALALRVQGAGHDVLGALRPIGPAAGFPLQYLRLPTSVAHRMALVGDAAHGLHPLAGQGVNLGFGDAEALAAVLSERGPVDDPGAPVLLGRYARRRAEPVLAMQAVTDGLARLFGRPSPWLRVLRNAGMSAVDRLPVLKRALAQPALR
jgi:2-octaprenyl-6-methoxyphenol hydroxylase